MLEVACNGVHSFPAIETTIFQADTDSRQRNPTPVLACYQLLDAFNAVVSPSDSLPKPKVNYVFTENNTLTLNPVHLSEVSKFKQLYLTSKILGESLPLKLITSKCVSEWMPIREVSIVDIVIAFTLFKFVDVMK